MPDIQIEDYMDCPVIGKQCDYYTYQCDSNGEVAICHCAHPNNPDSAHEGNCTLKLCPLPKSLSELLPV